MIDVPESPSCPLGRPPATAILRQPSSAAADLGPVSLLHGREPVDPAGSPGNSLSTSAMCGPWSADDPSASIHAPGTGATRVGGAGRRFNPRPRTGGDTSRPSARRAHPVSIHAPVKGATHVHLWQPATYHVQFQSTPPRGGDTSSDAAEVTELVSIHAPARGATQAGRAGKRA